MTTLPQLGYEPNNYSDCYIILIKYVLIKFRSLIHLFLSTETLRENNSINTIKSIKDLHREFVKNIRTQYFHFVHLLKNIHSYSLL